MHARPRVSDRVSRTRETTLARAAGSALPSFSDIFHISAKDITLPLRYLDLFPATAAASTSAAAPPTRVPGSGTTIGSDARTTDASTEGKRSSDSLRLAPTSDQFPLLSEKRERERRGFLFFPCLFLIEYFFHFVLHSRRVFRAKRVRVYRVCVYANETRRKTVVTDGANGGNGGNDDSDATARASRDHPE